MDLQFDVAFSYAGQDAWIAKDLCNLIEQSGLSVYCYDRQPDRTGGFLHTHLLDIYRDSRLNVVLWSRSYNSASPDGPLAMERRCIIHRHIEKGAAESLLVLRIDDEPLARDIEVILAHDVRREGIFRTERLVIGRIGRLSGAGKMEHPPTTESMRGPLRPCEFTVDPRYQNDPRGRWRELADVLVKIPNPLHNPLHTPAVYLIPSGSCSPLLRHSVMLRSEPDLLERKRRATEDFVRRYACGKIQGYWFAMSIGQAEVATVYAAAYDAALNASLLEDDVPAASGDPAGRSQTS